VRKAREERAEESRSRAKKPGLETGEEPQRIEKKTKNKK